MIAPVHAPVPGAGTPTKRASASVRDWPVGRPAFFSARASSGAASFLTKFERSPRSVGAIGTMLPMTQMTRVASGERPIQLPTGTPPRSSTAGTIEMSMSTAHRGGSASAPLNLSAIFWPRCRCSPAPAADAATASAGTRSDAPTANAARGATRCRAGGGGCGLLFLRARRSKGRDATATHGRARSARSAGWLRAAPPRGRSALPRKARAESSFIRRPKHSEWQSISRRSRSRERSHLGAAVRAAVNDTAIWTIRNVGDVERRRQILDRVLVGAGA